MFLKIVSHTSYRQAHTSPALAMRQYKLLSIKQKLKSHPRVSSPCNIIEGQYLQTVLTLNISYSSSQINPFFTSFFTTGINSFTGTLMILLISTKSFLPSAYAIKSVIAFTVSYDPFLLMVG